MAGTNPSREKLESIALAQGGLFSARQAGDAGYSAQLLRHHLHGGRVQRVRRGIYRLVPFPPSEQDELIVAWLWSEQAGVVSHQTALALNGLSDLLPAHVHLTLPESWRRARLKLPTGLALHFADLPESDRSWMGAVPITRVARTLNDCARAGLAPDLLREAAQQALERGLVERGHLAEVREALLPYGDPLA